MSKSQPGTQIFFPVETHDIADNVFAGETRWLVSNALVEATIWSLLLTQCPVENYPALLFNTSKYEAQSDFTIRKETNGGQTAIYQPEPFILFPHLKIDLRYNSKCTLVMPDNKFFFPSFSHSRNNVQQIFIECSPWVRNFL